MGGGRGLSSLDQSASDDGSVSSFNFEASSVSVRNAYLDLFRSYENPPERLKTLQEYKDAIIRHKPGDWIERAGGLTLADYDVPETTTLLLVGPRGSGKSSLVNRITRVFEEDKFAPDRAQVSYNVSLTNGSYFLQEYMVPRNNSSLCLYDNRSLLKCKDENFANLCSWMVQGVKHGMMVTSQSDSSRMRLDLSARSRGTQDCPGPERPVNFVIFVIDGVSVLKAVDDNDQEYNEMLVESFNYPYLSFKDDKPVVVVTHGDELSFHDRARVRIYMGDILGIPPSTQIFDIPDVSDCNTELAIVDMLRYSIEHADRNLPFNATRMSKRTRRGKTKGLYFEELVKGLNFNEWDTRLTIITEFFIFLCVVYIYYKGLSWLVKA